MVFLLHVGYHGVLDTWYLVAVHQMV